MPWTLLDFPSSISRTSGSVNQNLIRIKKNPIEMKTRADNKCENELQV